MNVQCIYISTPENTKILFYHLIIVSVAFAASKFCKQNIDVTK